MVLDYWLGELCGIRVATARCWRAVVGNILAASVPVFADFEDGTTEQPIERLPLLRLIHRLPCESEIPYWLPIAERTSEKPIAKPVELDLPPLPPQLGENLVTRFVLVTERRQTPGYIGTPRRIFGHDGSARLGKPDWSAIAEAVGAEAVSSVLPLPVSDCRRLEVLATMIVSGKAVCEVMRDSIAENCNRAGLAGVSDSTLTHRKFLVEDDVDAVLLRIVEREESRLEDTIRAATVAEGILEQCAAGLTIGLKAGLSVAESAKLCGVSTATAYRRIEAVRELLRKSGTSLPK